MELNETRVGLN